MDKNSKKRRFYSIMIVPHDAKGRPVSFKLPASWVYTMTTLTLLSVLVVTSSVIYSALVSRKLVNYADALNKTKEQQKVISAFSDKTDKVNEAVDELFHRDNELRKMLGLKEKEAKARLSTEIVSSEAKAKKVSTRLEEIDAKLAERRRSLAELNDWVNFVRSRLAATPSSWPLYGRIVSIFGYRSYPWRGFHAGIDIQARYGAPARVTAAGTVSYVGWRRGYGKTVEVNHGNGVTTLYAHNSNYAVVPGQRVRKGQVVCYVGTTGWTTGPHLHYEVRRWGAPHNPVAFLDLSVLSASRLWR